MRIVLIGASGFFGSYLLRALTDDGHHCEVLTRSATRRSHLELLAGVDLVQADVHDGDVLADRFEGADAVVSMAGILNESGHESFQKIHVELPEKIVSACRKAGVSRVLHLSALNAGKGESQYLKSKGEGEAILRSADDLNTSIFQPSVIFGKDDQFFNRFASMMSLAPVLPLACPKARLQPVYAKDVATVMTASLDDPMTWGNSYELAGPESFTLKELVEWTAQSKGMRRLVVGLPDPVSAIMATVMGWIPGKPFSRDNYLSLKTDNVSDQDGFHYFGVEPSSIELVVPYYLRGSSRQARLQKSRRQHPH